MNNRTETQHESLATVHPPTPVRAPDAEEQYLRDLAVFWLENTQIPLGFEMSEP